MTKHRVLTDDLLKELLLATLNWNEISSDRLFDVERISVENYLDKGIGNKLRECVMIKDCLKLSRKNEPTLTKRDVLTIMRYVLDVFGYEVVSLRDFKLWRNQYRIDRKCDEIN